MSKSNLNGPFELSGRDSFESARLSPGGCAFKAHGCGFSFYLICVELRMESLQLERSALCIMVYDDE